jgi:hypothetical protein
MDPLLVRLLIPLGVVATLFFVADFVVTSRWLARQAGRPTVTEGRKRNRILGITGLLLLTILGIVGAVTFEFRRNVSMRHVRDRESEAPGDTSARESLKKKVKLEYLACLGPFVIGSISGLTLRWLDRRWRLTEGKVGGQEASIDPH